MILQELVGVKRFHDHDLQQLVDAFSTNSGYEFLSRGRMAYAFATPGKNEVLKVWANDTAYEHFIYIANEWKRNKHVPRFFTKVKELTVFHRRSSVMPPKLKYIRMERLEKSSSFVMDGVTYKNKLLTKTLSSFLKTEDILADVEKFLAYVESSTKKPTGPELRFYAQTAMTILNEMIDYGAQDDLHEGNLMKRQDGTAVITDPGAFGKELRMAELIDKIEYDKEPDDRFNIVSGPRKTSDYDRAADSLAIDT